MKFSSGNQVEVLKVNCVNRPHGPRHTITLSNTLKRRHKKSHAMCKLTAARERRMKRSERQCWFHGDQTDKFWSNLCTGKLPAEDWKRNFRVDDSSFNRFCSQLDPLITLMPGSLNYRKLPASKKLVMALCYLSATGSLNQTANTFSVSQSTLSVFSTKSVPPYHSRLDPALISCLLMRMRCRGTRQNLKPYMP